MPTQTAAASTGVRIFMTEPDFKALLDKLEEIGWDHPVRWKIRTKWSEHTYNTVVEVKSNRRKK